MRRADVCLANLNPSRGSEQAGVRPVILVQREDLAQFTRTVVVVPCTTNLRRTQVPGTILIPAGEGGFTQDSVALCYQIVVIDQQRLIRQLGSLSAEYLSLLELGLKYTFALSD